MQDFLCHKCTVCGIYIEDYGIWFKTKQSKLDRDMLLIIYFQTYSLLPQCLVRGFDEIVMDLIPVPDEKLLFAHKGADNQSKH